LRSAAQRPFVALARARDLALDPQPDEPEPAPAIPARCEVAQIFGVAREASAGAPQRSRMREDRLGIFVEAQPF